MGSIGRSQCTRALVRMGTAVTSMATQLMTIGWQSGNVLAHKVSPLAPSCCLQQRRPSQLPTGLTSTIVQQPPWKQQADCKATFGGMSPKMSCLTDYCFAGKEVALNK